MVVMDFKTAADALEDRKNVVHLTTGSVEIDKLLEGGIETGSITEVVSRIMLLCSYLVTIFKSHRIESFAHFNVVASFFSVWRIPNGQDPTLPHSMCDLSNSV